MRQFHDLNASRIKELQTEPGPLVKKNIIKNSLSDDYENAKLEWEYIGHIPSDSPDFAENCELCNTPLHKGNFVIQNQNTKKVLRVGSDCIKRFIILAGTSSHEDSIRFLELKEKELDIEIELNVMYPAVVKDPVPLYRDVNKFRKMLLKLLEDRGQKHYLETKEGIKYIHGNIFKQHPLDPDGRVVDKLFTIFNDPKNLVVQRENKRWKEYKIKEGETWRKKGKVTGTTLSRSGAYDPEEKYR